MGQIGCHDARFGQEIETSMGEADPGTLQPLADGFCWLYAHHIVLDRQTGPTFRR